MEDNNVTIKKYKAFSAPTLEKLAELLTDASAVGWKLCGGPICTNFGLYGQQYEALMKKEKD